AAIIQQGIALARRTIARDRFVVALRVDEKAQEVALGRLNLMDELRISLEPVEASGTLARDQRAHRGPGRLAGMACMTAIDAQRAAMRPQFFDIEEAETMRGKNALHRQRGKVRKVFVINLIELVADHGRQQMREFDRANAVGLQDDLDAGDEGVE